MLITAESSDWIRDLASALGVEMHAKPRGLRRSRRFWRGFEGVVWRCLRRS
jgi:hypothetical protein